MIIMKHTIKRITNKLTMLYYVYLWPLFTYADHNVQCPFCGWQGKEFLPFGVIRRKNARCPKCGSLERDRLCYLYLKEVIPIDRKIKVLHFAPEKILTNLFESYNNIEYLSADIDPTKAMVKEDITNISFNDNSFDIIFCSHVLEHIEDDHKAMKELHRVLKPGGFAIIRVPIKDTFNGRKNNKTYEDFSVTSPKDREKLFGQKDHVRIYGRDYGDRLTNAGFKVKIDKYLQSLDCKDVKRYVLIPDSSDPEVVNETNGWIYVCTKQNCSIIER